MSIINTSSGISKAAFQADKLFCPFCQGTRWKYVENVGSFCIRYRCKDCHKTVLYDFSANPDHPYKRFGKGIWKQILEGLQAGKTSDEVVQKLIKANTAH